MSDTIPVSISDTNIFMEKGYVFNRLLGEGSYAKVWLVNYLVEDDVETTKEYSLACKIIDSKKAPRDFVNKFLPREMDVLTKIRHPHLIHLHSIYQRKSKFFIFMRFAEKGDLLDYILAHGEVKERQCRLWTRQLTLGLQYLHNLEIVHRDIKCENVLITSNDNVKLADFGFARFMVDIAGKRYQSSTYCGSLAYAAPELLKGKPYDPKRSDVWSLGVVVYVMLNQCMPFNDNDMNKLFEMQMSNKWSFRSKISATVTDEVKMLVTSMLTPDALQRIIIDDIVNHRWFAHDEKLRYMTTKEREALEAGLSNRSGLIPKSMRMTVPSWRKRRKDEQIVCMTSLRFESSSYQFQFEGPTTSTTAKPVLQQKSSPRDKNSEIKRPDEKPVQSSHIKSSDVQLKPKQTTSSVALIEEIKNGEDNFDKAHTSSHTSALEISSFLKPKAEEPMAELLDESRNNAQTEKHFDDALSISSDELQERESVSK